MGSITLRPRDSDAETFRQVFVARQYDIAGAPQHERILTQYREILERGGVPVIIDAGANVGAAALWFHTLFPEAMVYAIEPVEESARICRANVAGNEKIVVVEAAIGAAHGWVSIVLGDTSYANQTERGEGGSITVVTVDDILSIAGLRAELLVAKIDIEGFEADLFVSNVDWLDRTFALFIELHDWLLPGAGSSFAVQQALMGRGFEILLRGENLVFVRAVTPPH